jgi:septum formation inhibitor-activating ATPase MinD
MMLVLNKVDRRGGISAANVEETLKHTVAAQILIDDKTVLASINAGVPFITGPRGIPPVQGILDLAQRIRSDFAPKEAVVVPVKPAAKPTFARPAGLFQRR